MPLLTVVLLLLQSAGNPVILDNAYARVSKNAAPCATAGQAGCGDRVVVALGMIALRTPSGGARKMERGDIAVFKAQESYNPPAGGDYLEVAFKPDRPAAKCPAILIPPEKNTVLYDGDQFFVFEEKLPPGETRARHSHCQRVVVNLSATRLQQWPDGAAMLIRDQVPDNVHFNEPVVHMVKTIGDQPMRNIVIEFKPKQGR